MCKIILATLLTINLCSAQEFDRQLENTIKTEINLNRIAQSKPRLQRNTFIQKQADSLNQTYFKKYLSSIHETSRGIKKDFRDLHESLTEEMDKDVTVNYNFFVIDHADEYERELRGLMLDHYAYFYRLSTSEIALSVIRHNDKLFVTILSD